MIKFLPAREDAGGLKEHPHPRAKETSVVLQQSPRVNLSVSLNISPLAEPC